MAFSRPVPPSAGASQQQQQRQQQQRQPLKRGLSVEVAPGPVKRARTVESGIGMHHGDVTASCGRALRAIGDIYNYEQLIAMRGWSNWRS